MFTSEEKASRKVLLACSQVSRNFRLAVLPYLFHTVGFLSNGTKKDPCKCVGGYRCHSLCAFTTFVEECAALHDNIQELRIAAGCGLGMRMGSCVHIRCDELVTVLRTLPKLRVLRLRDLHLKWENQ